MNEERYEKFIGVSKKRDASKDQEKPTQHNSTWLANEKHNLGKYRLIYPIEMPEQQEIRQDPSGEFLLQNKAIPEEVFQNV